ncbi:MAG: HAD family hydrolase [Edaphobacter sp.]|jgi:putative hydrolase of the HAD superfamily
MPQFPPNQTLLIDADDTLWENNIYFERAIAAFTSYLDHQTHTPEQVRAILNACEHETIAANGYGLTSFRQSLVNCYRRLAVHPVTDEHVTSIHGFAGIIHEHPIELLPGVAETLASLSTHHRLILMTKGDTVEQTGKLERSGLAPHFSAVEIVAEKDPATYSAVIARHNLTPATSWMIGNSPKSDINPALAAGLHAVFLFHSNTWTLEHADLSTPPPGQQLIELDAFTKLSELF